MHWTTIRCECSPKVKSVVDEQGERYFVLIHRRMRNSRNLFKPWEGGH